MESGKRAGSWSLGVWGRVNKGVEGRSFRGQEPLSWKLLNELITYWTDRAAHGRLERR